MNHSEEYISLHNLIDVLWGKKVSPERDRMEGDLQHDLDAFYMGEAIRKTRPTQNMTQPQLSKLIGIQSGRSFGKQYD